MKCNQTNGFSGQVWQIWQMKKLFRLVTKSSQPISPSVFSFKCLDLIRRGLQ